MVNKGANLFATTQKYHYDPYEMPLHLATIGGQLEVIKYILSKQPNFFKLYNRHIYTPLHLAAMNGRQDIIKYFIDYGLDVNISGDKNRGNTALYTSINFGKTESIRTLLKNGANPIITQRGGKTPLEQAVSIGDYNVVKLLIEHGANVDYTNPYVEHSYGTSTVFIAAGLGKNNILELLLDISSKNINKRDARGNTPLMAAAREHKADGNYPETIKILLKYGANVNATNKRGETALFIKKLKGKKNPKIVKILQENGGK